MCVKAGKWTDKGRIVSLVEKAPKARFRAIPAVYDGVFQQGELVPRFGIMNREEFDEDLGDGISASAWRRIREHPYPLSTAGRGGEIHDYPKR